MNPTTSNSNRVRLERALTRAAVQRGVSLTVLLRECRPELEGVRIAPLTRWCVGVGDAKADRILLGLPHHYRLRDLKPATRQVLIERIAEAERQLIRQRLKETPACPPST